MAKIRVHELAKKLNMTNKALLTKLKAMNIEVKSHMSSLEDETINQIKLNIVGNKQKDQDSRVGASVIRRRKKNKNAIPTIPSTDESLVSLPSEKNISEPQISKSHGSEAYSQRKPQPVETHDRASLLEKIIATNNNQSEDMPTQNNAANEINVSKNSNEAISVNKIETHDYASLQQNDNDMPAIFRDTGNLGRAEKNQKIGNSNIGDSNIADVSGNLENRNISGNLENLNISRNLEDLNISGDSEDLNISGDSEELNSEKLNKSKNEIYCDDDQSTPDKNIVENQLQDDDEDSFEDKDDITQDKDDFFENDKKKKRKKKQKKSEPAKIIKLADPPPPPVNMTFTSKKGESVETIHNLKGDFLEKEKNSYDKDKVSPSKEHTSFDKERVSANRDRTPFDKERVSANRERTTFDKERVSANRERTPFDKDKVSANRERTPFDKDKISANRERTPFDKDKVSANRERTTFDKDKVSANRERTPFDKDKISANRERTPFDKDKVSANRERTPFDKDKVSANRERTPFDKDKVSANRERTPFDKDKVSANRERTPFNKDKSVSRSPYNKSDVKSETPLLKARAKKIIDIDVPFIPIEPLDKDDLKSKRKKSKVKKKKWGDDENVTEESKIGQKKRKSIVEGKDLYEDGFSARKSRKKDGKTKQRPKVQKTQITVPKAIKRRIKIDETIDLSELAKRMSIKANEMIQKLMGMGIMVTVNQTIDFDTATLVAAEFDYEVEKAAVAEDMLSHANEIDNPDNLISRSPVVTIMGHVDHGKTSLLDVIRKSKITTGEAGGITQHIGAYSVKTPKGGIVTFLDTPGHAAFTSMRSRGAKITDIVVLVVAADDGVMPQTVEAINHSKAAGVPVVVAVNKIDKPNADSERVMRELSEHGLLSEEWGGDVIFAKVSAKKKQGIDELLDLILLQAEVLELKANPDRLAKGHVVEARLDAGRGPVATVLVQQGTLKIGQPVVCGLHSGKIRIMADDMGKNIDTAGPSTPVEIVGLSGVPEAGDEFIALASEKDAKNISESRMQKERAKELAKKSRANLEKLFANMGMGSGQAKQLKLVIKADVHGSLEAINESLMKLSQEEVDVKIVHSGTGAINESDVSLAAVSDAIIIGFNVRPTPKVREMAKEENVDMRFYDIIYNVINDIKTALTGLMPSTFHEIIIGRAEIRDTFVIPGKGTIAGCFVQDGKVARGEKIRLLRDGVIKCDSSLSSLRRFKDDAKEVTQGFECGIGIEKFNDLKVGDIIECYEIEERKASLESLKESTTP